MRSGALKKKGDLRQRALSTHHIKKMNSFSFIDNLVQYIFCWIIFFFYEKLRRYWQKTDFGASLNTTPHIAQWLSDLTFMYTLFLGSYRLSPVNTILWEHFLSLNRMPTTNLGSFYSLKAFFFKQQLGRVRLSFLGSYL